MNTTTPPPSTAPSAWRPPTLTPRRELAIAAMITIVAVVATGWLTRNNWFHVDVWDPLTARSLGNLDDVMRPRNGHWAVPQVVQTRLLYGLVGMEFMPVHQLPRLVGWPIVAFAAWRLMRWRGADPYVAFGAYAVLLMLGTSWFVQPWFVGMGVVALSLFGIARLVQDRDDPTLGDRAWLFALMVAGLMSAGTMVGVLIGTGAAVIVARRWRPWATPILASGVVYAAWFFWYDVADAEGIDLTLSSLLSVPYGVVRLFAGALPKVLGLPQATAPVLAVLLIGYLSWLAYRRRLDLFDGVLLASVAGFLALVVIRRGVNLHDRYSNDTLLWLAPVLAPMIRIPMRRAAWIVAGVIAAAVLTANVVRLESGISDRTAGLDASRAVIETAAALIEAGEPYVRSASLDQVFARPLDASGLQRVVGDGWRPSPDPGRIAEARGLLRAAFVEDPSEAGGVFRTSTPLDAGCSKLRADETLDIEVIASGALQITGPRGRPLSVEWNGETGSGSYVSERRSVETLHLEVAAPAGGRLSITAVGPGGAVEFCGLTG